MKQDLPDIMDAWTATKMLLPHAFIKTSHSYIPCITLLSVFSHSLYSYSRCLTLPRVHWSCLFTLQCTKTFQPICTQQSTFAERIFSLLNPADLCSCLQVCTTWNYQVSTAPRFMDKVSAYRRKCKENAENRHASKKQKEVIVFPTQRQPLSYLQPQHFDTNPEQRDMFNCRFIQLCQACMAREWLQWESESQQETKTV